MDAARGSWRGLQEPALRHLLEKLEHVLPQLWAGPIGVRALQLLDDAIDGPLAVAELEDAGRTRVQGEAPLRVEEQVSAGSPIEAQARLRGESGLVRGRDHRSAPHPPEGGEAKNKQSKRCQRISVLRTNAATHFSC